MRLTAVKEDRSITASAGLSVVIVNWNSKDYLRGCLESLFETADELDLEVVVVDSGSFDGCDKMLAGLFPRVRFVQSQENVGFASANNIGVRLCSRPYLLFLNPDTEVLPGSIAALDSFVRTANDAGVVSPKLLNTDRSLQTSCVQTMPTILNQLLDIEWLHRWFPHVRLWRTAAAFEREQDPAVVEALSGACMMIRRDVFDRVGGFSPDYFMYAEDLDLCWKVRRMGYRNYYVPFSKVVHHGGGSSQHGRSHFSEVMVPESVSRLLRKTHGPLYSMAFRCALSFSAALRLTLVAATLPVGIALHRVGKWRVVFKKWLAILRWSLGMERWVKKYGRST